MVNLVFSLILIGLVVGGLAFIIRTLAKSALKRIEHKEALRAYNKRFESNPYIQQHQAKIKNDELYDEYMDWASKHGEGVPVPKIVTKEDAEADKKVKRLFKPLP